MVNERDETCLIVIVGKPRKGKSYIALKIATTIDPTFNERTYKKRVAFSPTEFMRIVSQNLENLPYGSVIMYEEAGANISVDEWYTYFSKATSKILQTFGHRNFVVIFTVPDMDFINNKVKKMIDFCVEAIKKEKYCKNCNYEYTLAYKETKCKVCGGDIAIKNVFKVFKWQYNSFLKKYYRKYIIRGSHKWKMFKTLKPKNAKLVELYEKASREWKMKLSTDSYDEANAMEQTMENDRLRRTTNESELAANILYDKKLLKQFTKVRKKTGYVFVDPDMIDMEYHIGMKKAIRVKKLIEIEVNRK